MYSLTTSDNSPTSSDEPTRTPHSVQSKQPFSTPTDSVNQSHTFFLCCDRRLSLHDRPVARKRVYHVVIRASHRWHLDKLVGVLYVTVKQVYYVVSARGARNVLFITVRECCFQVTVVRISRYNFDRIGHTHAHAHVRTHSDARAHT